MTKTDPSLGKRRQCLWMVFFFFFFFFFLHDILFPIDDSVGGGSLFFCNFRGGIFFFCKDGTVCRGSDSFCKFREGVYFFCNLGVGWFFLQLKGGYSLFAFCKFFLSFGLKCQPIQAWSYPVQTRFMWNFTACSSTTVGHLLEYSYFSREGYLSKMGTPKDTDTPQYRLRCWRYAFCGHTGGLFK